jgi:EpsD family peptidyl-prolyl cis-trans isomerase
MPRNFPALSLSLVRHIAFAAAALAFAAVVTGCGERAKATTQVAAKVNKEEISIHQVNFLLSRQPGIQPEHSSSASRQILDRLIDQELALQKAQEFKLDREPNVVQAIEAARRDIISRAYIDRVSDTAARPTADEVKKYFDEKPGLFSNRRVYQLHEFMVETQPEQIEALRAQLKQVKTAGEFAQYLRSKEIRFASNQSVRPAEQLPLAAVDVFAQMKDGQAIFMPTASGAEVTFVIASQTVPVDETTARPAIQQYLWNERRRQLVEKDIKALRDASKIEYVGAFAASPSSAMTVASPQALPAEAVRARADVIK